MDICCKQIGGYESTTICGVSVQRWANHAIKIVSIGTRTYYTVCYMYMYRRMRTVALFA